MNNKYQRFIYCEGEKETVRHLNVIRQCLRLNDEEGIKINLKRIMRKFYVLGEKSKEILNEERKSS